VSSAVRRVWRLWPQRPTPNWQFDYAAHFTFTA
jgi:hypothetical protein